MNKKILIRILLVVLTLALVFSIAACGNKKTPVTENPGDVVTPPVVESKDVLTKDAVVEILGLTKGLITTAGAIDDKVSVDASLELDAFGKKLAVQVKANLVADKVATEAVDESKGCAGEIIVKEGSVEKFVIAYNGTDDVLYIKNAFAATAQGYKYSNIADAEIYKGLGGLVSLIAANNDDLGTAAIDKLASNSMIGTVCNILKNTQAVKYTKTDSAHTIALQSDKLGTLITSLGDLPALKTILESNSGLINSVCNLLFGVQDLDALKNATPAQIANFPTLSIVVNYANSVATGITIDYKGDLDKVAGQETLALSVKIPTFSTSSTVSLGSYSTYAEGAVKATLALTADGKDLGYTIEAYVDPNFEAKPAAAKAYAILKNKSGTALGTSLGYYDGSKLYFDMAPLLGDLGMDATEIAKLKTVYSVDFKIFPTTTEITLMDGTNEFDKIEVEAGKAFDTDESYGIALSKPGEGENMLYFNGWAVNKDSATVYDAQYVSTGYTLTIMNGAEVISNGAKSIIFEEASLKDDAIAAGKVLKGYYEDAAFTKKFRFPAKLTADTTIYAKVVDGVTADAPEFGLIDGDSLMGALLPKIGDVLNLLIDTAQSQAIDISLNKAISLATGFFKNADGSATDVDDVIAYVNSTEVTAVINNVFGTEDGVDELISTFTGFDVTVEELLKAGATGENALAIHLGTLDTALGLEAEVTLVDGGTKKDVLGATLTIDAISAADFTTGYDAADALDIGAATDILAMDENNEYYIMKALEALLAQFKASKL